MKKWKCVESGHYEWFRKGTVYQEIKDGMIKDRTGEARYVEIMNAGGIYVFEEVTDSEPVSDGETANYYAIPEDATELKHLISHKKMNHSIGEAFCALYRLHDKADVEYNLKKVKSYIDFELEQLQKRNKFYAKTSEMLGLAECKETV